MNFVAATLLVEVRRERTAFALYAYMLKELHVESLYGRTLPQVLCAFELALRMNAPRVHSHLRSEGFEPQLYAVESFSVRNLFLNKPPILSL